MIDNKYYLFAFQLSEDKITRSYVCDIHPFEYSLQLKKAGMGFSDEQLYILSFQEISKEEHDLFLAVYTYKWGKPWITYAT